jgi:hypothetical protein
MTVRKSTLRPRRSTSAENLPRDLAAWFAGDRPPKTEDPPLILSDARRAEIQQCLPERLSRAERRALGLPVEPLPSQPWSALIYPDYVLLPERWVMWKEAHPDAKPPAGYEWIADPNSSQHPPAWLLAEARRCANRSRK